MWRFDLKTGVTLALMAFASLASIAPVSAQGDESRQRQAHRPAEGARPAARRAAAAYQVHRAYPARGEQGAHAAAGREAVGRSLAGSHIAGTSRVHVVSRSVDGGQVRVIHYDNALSGTVERTIRPGLMSRTYVSGGHVLYAHVYQRHVWRQFGRAFAYETFVPAVRYPGVYYTWALAPWSHPVAYSWGWQVQPWYPAYGLLFSPYPVYTSPDLWMTDYIIAQSMQRAYQAQTVAPQSSDAPPMPQSSDTPSGPVVLPPAVTPQVKAQLDAQIKVQLQEQQGAVATPATLTTQSTPPALRPNHVFFQVVQPLDVPLATANGHCSLSANDYIRRAGPMSDDDWMIPVVVELSRPSDCPEGLQTRIGLNDLNAMENEQQAQVMEAMQAASKSMGPNGPPSGPGAHPTLIADGSAAPDPTALDAIRQAQ
jgi:hypothetical protein